MRICILLFFISIANVHAETTAPQDVEQLRFSTVSFSFTLDAHHELQQTGRISVLLATPDVLVGHDAIWSNGENASRTQYTTQARIQESHFVT